MHYLLLRLLVFVFAVCLLHQTVHAAPIPIPEGALDSAEFVITNYSWVNANFIDVCEPGQVPCDGTARMFSDQIGLFNTGGRAHILFFSDLESPISDTPGANDVFRTESPTFSFDADATATNGVVATLRLNFSSDLNPTPRPGDLPSDSVEVILRPPPPPDAPPPDLQPIPEPSTLLLLGAGLVGLTWYRKRSGSGSTNK